MGDKTKENLSSYLITAGLALLVYFGMEGIKNWVDKRVNYSIEPSLKDLNNDSLDDLVLKLNSGEDLILYKTDKGYNFNKP